MSAIAEEELSPEADAADSPPPVDPPELSQRLTRPLQVVAGRARLLALLKAAAQLLTLLLTLTLLLALLLGSIRHLPPAVAFLATALAGFASLAGLFFLFRPALRRRDLASTARLVDNAIPDTDERLSSALELSQLQDPRFHGSPELIAALVRQAEQAAQEVDPHAVVSTASVLRWSIALLPLLLVWFILLLVSPTTSLGLHRLLQPWLAAAPLPTATLEIDPQNVTVAQGDSVRIKVQVTPAAGTLPPDAQVDKATITRRFAAGNTNEDVSADMERTGSRAFAASFDNLQQTFSYRIDSLDGRSPTYTVTVQQRPSVNGIQIDYTYPAYIHRDPHSDKSRDGAIDALVGTRVKLTIDATQPLSTAKVVISDNSPDPGTLTLSPVGGSATQFTAEFTVRKSTDYHLQLVNAQGLDSGDTTAHPIVARMDAPPQVSIISPAGPQLKVRPDDVVPIKFTATDDFALTRIEAITQVDERPPTITQLPLPATGQTTINGTWTLSLPDLLRTVAVAPPALPAPRRITYQLRVTDNRAPDLQVGLSAKQSLDLDRAATPLAAREDTQAAHTLGEAITQAARDLDAAKFTIDTLRRTAGTRPLIDTEKSQLADARRQIADAAQSLQSAADKTNDSRLADMAHQATEIANKPLHDAGEQAAAGQIAADQPDARDKSLAASSKSLGDARGQLDRLARDLSEKAKDQPLAHELERIAAEQRRLADALTRNPHDPSLLAQQRQLQQDLEKVIRDHPELQKPAADAAQAKADELQRKLDAVREAQRPLNEQAHAQEEAANAQDKLNDLAKKQAALNQQVNQFAQQQADKLKNANTRMPPPSQVDSIGKDLQDRKLASAAQSQNAAATQLEQAAQQLENADKRDQETGRSPEQLQQSAKDTQAMQEQAQQLQKQIEDAQKNHNPPTLPSDPANQKASQLADQVKRQAQQMSQSPATSAAAKEAAAEADAAKRDAAGGNAASAQQHLSTATSRLAQAAKSAAPQANQSTQESTAAAAAKARELARQQRELAAQTSQTDRAIDQAADSRANGQQAAQQQQAVADKMEEAAKTARELQQQTQGGAPGISQQAKQAADALEKGAQAQRAAAKASQSGKSEQAQSQQQQAESAVSRAQQSMGGKPGEQASSGQKGASGQQAGSSSSGESPGGSAGASSSASSTPGGAGNSSSPGQPSSAGGAGQSSAGGSRTGPAGTPGSESASGSSDSATAQAVQSARSAQSQAASGNPTAARQAADQLSQASQQLLSGNGGGSAAATASPAIPGAQPGNGAPSGMPGDQALSGGNGNRGPAQPAASPPAGPRELPKAVEEVGVSPSDWARLPPAMQEQLLNSAQQSGPPAYRDMIKNYYSRIARLQEEPGATP